MTALRAARYGGGGGESGSWRQVLLFVMAGAGKTLFTDNPVFGGENNLQNVQILCNSSKFPYLFATLDNLCYSKLFLYIR